jgi:Universal stress protein family
MKRFKDILCVAAPGAECKPVLERAVTLAENNQASLTVVEVTERITAGIRMPKGGPNAADLQAATIRAHEQEMDSLIEPCRQRIDMQAKVLIGTPFLEIVREVLRNGRDLVIKTAEICDWQDRLFGSDDMHLLRKCPCPVWLIKAEAPKSFRCILAAVDADDECAAGGADIKASVEPANPGNGRFPRALRVRPAARRPCLGGGRRKCHARRHHAYAGGRDHCLRRTSETASPEESGWTHARGRQHPGAGCHGLSQTPAASGKGMGAPGNSGAGQTDRRRSCRHGHRGPYRFGRLHHGQYRGGDSISDRLFGTRDQAPPVLQPQSCWRIEHKCRPFT